MSSEFTVGESFSSYVELERKVKSYQSAKFIQLTHRDSRTLAMAKRRVPKRVEGANSALIYYTIHYACVFGGKKYKSNGTRQRIQQR